MKIATYKEGEGKDATYTGVCDGVNERLCGHPDSGTPFTTTGWPTAEIAEDRIRQHHTEHTSGELMEPLTVFRARHGLVPDDTATKAVFPKGAKTITTEEEEGKG